MNQYFDDNRHLKSNRKEISFRFWCFNYSFIVDHGVFSKDEVDTGSQILLNQVLTQPLGAKILDLGCGYGPIGIILKTHFKESYIEMVDVNPRALELAKENAIHNNIEANIHLSNAFEDIETKDFTAIVVNPPIRAGKIIIYKMFQTSFEHLQIGGCLWVVIRKSHGAQSAKKKIEEVYGNCEIVKKEKGFYVLCAKKY